METTRRALLGAVVAGTAAVAGCSGTESSTGSDCDTTATDQGSEEVLQQAIVRAGDDGSAVLAITFQAETASDSGATHLIVTDAGDTVEARIPVEDRRTYSLAIGAIPTHGTYRIAAVDEGDTELDWLTVEFNCFERTSS